MIFKHIKPKGSYPKSVIGLLKSKDRKPEKPTRKIISCLKE